MKQVLKYLTDDALLYIKDKDNIEEFAKEMCKHPHSTDWIKSFCGSNPFVNSGYEFDFTFEPFDKNYVTKDIKNAIALYELFEENNIGPAVIYNEKFLTGFIFTFGYEYFMNVMGADKVSHVAATLFFDDGVHRAVVRNVVGQLYRYVAMSVDENLADRYELTKYMFQNPALFRIKYNTNVDGDKTTKAIIRAFKEWTDETHKSPDTGMVEKVKTHISVLAGISETELMNERYLINYLKDYIYNCERWLWGKNNENDNLWDFIILWKRLY